MPSESYSNNASTTVATSSTGTTTGSKTVTATASFPQTGQFHALIENEIVVASVVDGTHLNLLTRGAEGTLAVDHAVGVTITHILTAESLWALRNPLLSRLSREDDFLFGLDSGNPKGSLNWYCNGGSGLTNPAPVAGHPGVVQLGTGNSANACVVLNAHDGGNDGGVLASEMFDLTWVLQLGQSDANTVIQAGLRRDANTNVTSGSPSDGIYFEKQAADTDWFYVCRASGTQTRVDSGVATGTGYVTLRMRRVDAATIAFSINGGTESTITTNIPTVAPQPSVALGTTTAVSKTVNIDYFGLLITSLSR